MTSSLCTCVAMAAAAAAPRRDGPAGRWVLANDSRVHEVAEYEVLRAQPYMLYYVRANLDPEELTVDGGAGYWYPVC